MQAFVFHGIPCTFCTSHGPRFYHLRFPRVIGALPLRDDAGLPPYNILMHRLYPTCPLRSHLGFPGSIASLRQQAGRAGRREQPCLSLLVAFDGPLDQHFMRHPEQLFGRPIERVQVCGAGGGGYRHVSGLVARCCSVWCNVGRQLSSTWHCITGLTNSISN